MWGFIPFYHYETKFLIPNCWECFAYQFVRLVAVDTFLLQESVVGSFGGMPEIIFAHVAVAVVIPPATNNGGNFLCFDLCTIVRASGDGFYFLENSFSVVH